MKMDYTWNTLENWFINGSTETRIIGLILAIVISILAIWFTFEILKLTFLLVIEILKATFMGHSILFYTLIVAFLTAPIGLISGRDDLSTIIENYFLNVKQIIHIFYPKLFKDEKNKKLFQTPTPAPTQHQRPVVRRAEEATVIHKKYPKYESRSEELNSKTMIISHPKSSSNQGPKFFCTDCGEEFTPKMKVMLTENSHTFCEHCGKKFNQLNNLPISA
jgi:hypothetical protein